jgi:hypothetical protein
MDSNLSPKQIQEVEKMLQDYKSGHLNEKILLKAVHNISDHHSGKVMEYLIILLMFIFGYLLHTGFFKSGQVSMPDIQMPEISTSKVKGAKPNLVWKDNFLDDSPLGSYDFTLIADGNVKGVAVPSPCDGKIAISEEIQGYGFAIAVDCKQHRYFMAHLAEKGLPIGTVVKEHSFIAIQGSTGRSTGEHIHMEISPTGTDKRISDRAITAPLVLSYIGKIR